jgi:hypothetical protein
MKNRELIKANNAKSKIKRELTLEENERLDITSAVIGRALMVGLQAFLKSLGNSLAKYREAKKSEDKVIG